VEPLQQEEKQLWEVVPVAASLLRVLHVQVFPPVLPLILFLLVFQINFCFFLIGDSDACANLQRNLISSAKASSVSQLSIATSCLCIFSGGLQKNYCLKFAYKNKQILKF